MQFKNGKTCKYRKPEFQEKFRLWTNQITPGMTVQHGLYGVGTVAVSPHTHTCTKDLYSTT